MSDTNKGPSFKVKGVLTSYEYDFPKYGDKSKKLHQIGIKFDEGERDKLVDYVNSVNIYDEVSDTFKPSWYKPEKDKDKEYLNIKSQFDITAFYRDEHGQTVQTTLADLVADQGSVSGSDVTINLTFKPGATYPLAIAFRTLKVKTFEDFFDAEDLPFN